MSRKIVFLLFPKTHLLDLAGPAQVFYEASRMGGSNYQIIYCAANQAIEFAQGATISTVRHETLFLRSGDFVCVPGIDFQSFKLGEMDPVITTIQIWLTKQRQRGVFVGSICSGALILAKLGILDRTKCTTHWKCLNYLKKSFPKCRVQEKRLYCFDNGIFTSAGMTAGIDMSLALIEQWDSPLVAARVAKEMVINVRRPELVDQENIYLDYKNHFNPDVYRAQEILSNNLQTKFTVADLAGELHKSPRHLARLFKDHTGDTMQEYRDRVRIKLGEKLLLHTERSIKEIAVECGFDDTRQFLRLWKKTKGATPKEFRNKTKISVNE
ncbi:MAG: helix-turn-helix domain-containing protein [Saprospiraceae bacterium]|nr:helix-turn-helix domain-containing protein [Saprospiraceae bacterium]